MRRFQPTARLRHLLDRILRCGILAFIGLSPLHASRLPAQPREPAPVLSDSAMQALYLYNFAKFIDWPDKIFLDKRTPIRLCLYGEKPNELRQSVAAIEGKSAHGRDVAVRRQTTLAELNDCQIVFIPDSEKRWLSEVLRVAHASSALTVSDMEGFVDSGGGVGLFMSDRQLRFDVNLNAIETAQLKVSSQLLKLARTVRGQGVRN